MLHVTPTFPCENSDSNLPPPQATGLALHTVQIYRRYGNNEVSLIRAIISDFYIYSSNFNKVSSYIYKIIMIFKDQ